MAGSKEFLSLDQVSDSHNLWLCGAIFDPVLEAVLKNEEEHACEYVGASILDWDYFAVVHASYRAEVNAIDRAERKAKRNGAPASKGGRKRVLPEFKCIWCGTFFRPQSGKKKLCSRQCASRYISKQSKYGSMIDRIEAATGLRRNLIAQRLVRGWTEEKCISTALQKKKVRGNI